MSSSRIEAVAVIMSLSMIVSCTTVPIRSTGSGEQWTIEKYDQDPCSDAYKMQHRLGSVVAGGILGAGIGGVAGALIDHLRGDRSYTTAKTLAIAGMITGMLASYSRTEDAIRRQCDLYRQAVAMNVQARFVRLQHGKDGGGEVAVTADQGHFVAGTATLTPEGENYYRGLARQYTSQVQLSSYQQTIREAARTNPAMADLSGYEVDPKKAVAMQQEWEQMRIILIGHTDDQGTAQELLTLSERRAYTVTNVFKSEGVPAEMLHYQGAGAAYPIADNNSAEGRSLNNRVEVIALRNQSELDAYASARRTTLEYFSPLTPKPNTSDSIPGVASAPAGLAQQTQPPAKSNVPASAALKSSSPSKAGAQTKASQERDRQPSLANSSGRAPLPSRASGTSGNSVPGSSAGSVPSGIAQAPARSNPVATRGNVIPDYFQGEPVVGGGPALVDKIGKLESASEGFTLTGLFGIQTAAASAVYRIKNCYQDDPERYLPNAIKRFKDNQPLPKVIRPRDWYPGAYGNAFQATVGNNRVGLQGIGVSRTGEVAHVPELLVYKDWQTTKDPDANPDFRAGGKAVAVIGTQGMLLREYFSVETSLQCVDVLFPIDASAQKRPAAVFYARGDATLMVVKQIDFVVVPKK